MTALLIVIYIAYISLGLPDSLFGTAWPVVHTEFGLDQSFASVYTILTGLCTGGISFVAGKLLRKYGTGRVTFVSTLLTAVALLGMSFSPNIVVMMLCAVLLGYGAGAIDTGLNNYVSLHYEARHMNWLHCFWGLGVTVSPLIMSAFLGRGSWRGGYRVVALLQAGIALLLLVTLKKWNREPKEAAPRKESPAPEKSMLQLLRSGGVLTSILSLGLYCSGEFIVGTWGATYAVNIYSLPPEDAAKWVALYYGGIMVGRVISGFASFRLSDDTMIKGGMALAVLGMIVLALPLGPVSLVGLLLIGVGYGPVFPSVIHAIPSRFGAEYSADITGYHQGGAYLIGFLIQMSYGYLATATTFHISPYVLMLLGAGVVAATLVTLRTLKKQKAKEA